MLGPDGAILVLKPAGMTSHDVVGFVRRLLGVRRVGHAGTLDPDAVGLLIILVGRATRAAEYLLGAPKEYVTEVVFGAETDTDDAGGSVVRRARGDVLASEVDAALPQLTGSIMQVPPAFSALKHGGKPMYEWARRGCPVEPEARQVEVLALSREGWRTDPASVVLRVRCGSGTYIRALARDLGRLVGSAAHVSFLLRTSTGPHHVNQAWTLEELEAWAGGSGAEDPMFPLGEALSFMDRVEVPDDGAVLSGVSPALEAALTDGLPVRLYGRGGRFLAVAHVDSGSRVLRLHKVFALREDLG